MPDSMSIGGDSFIGDIRNIPAVSISHMIVDMLDPAVGEGHPVGAGGGVPVPLLVLPEVCAAVVVGDAVLVGVVGRLLVVATSGPSGTTSGSYGTTNGSSETTSGSSSKQRLGHHAGDQHRENNSSLKQIMFICKVCLGRSKPRTRENFKKDSRALCGQIIRY